MLRKALMQAGPPSTPTGGSGVARAALKGLCPRCGAKSLFAGIADFARRCRACDLDFSAFNVGDGPAAFLTLLIELTVEPAWWVHLLLWLPISAAAVAGSLRFAKGMLITLEYQSSAREGRMAGKE